MGDRRASDTYRPFAQLGQFMDQVMEADFFSVSPTLHRLASEGNETELLDLINSGIEINEEDDNGLTALHHAAEGGHAKCVEILLQNGANVNGNGSTLHMVRDVKCAQLLLKAKATLNAHDERGNSPLQTAIRKGRQELAEFFLSVGADVHCTNTEGETPLHTLCSSFMAKPHDEKLTRKMIEMGANVHSKDSQGRSPLHLAVMNYHIEKTNMVNMLITAGASATDLDRQGMNPIHRLIDKCRPYSEDDIKLLLEIFDLLVTTDSEANSKNVIGQTILHLAILAGAPLQVLEYLVQKGCRPTAEDGQKRSLLHCVVKRELDDDIDILNFLLNTGLDINCADIWGQTVLHHAVEKNRKKLVKALVECGADVNVKDSVGRQPVHIAAEKGWDVICNWLITRGANINAQDKYQSTPLHFAAMTNKAPVAHLLIKAGCDVALRDACGQTAEEVAKFWSSLDFLQIMHEKDENYELELEQRKKLLSKLGGELLQLKTFQDLIDSSEESLRMSGTLNEFLNCVISTPGIGTVFKDPEAGEIRDVVDRFASNVVKRIAESHPKMRCTLYHAGSSSEETKTKFPDEFDYVVCLDELSENICPKHETEDVVKSVLFVPDREASEQVKEVLEKGVDYKETSSSVSNYTQIFLKDHTSHEYSEFTQDLEPNWRAIPSYMMFNVFTQQLSNIVFGESFPQDERLEIKEVTNDPKLSLLWKGSRYKTLAIEVDFVPAVRLPSWPDKFRMQSPLLDSDLLQLPFLAVPKLANQDEFLWRCSLCLVETAIMKRCRHRIRNSYIAAKSLISSAICPLVSFEDYRDAKMQYASQHDSLSSDEDFELYENVEGAVPSYILKMAFFLSIEEKAKKDGVETVYREFNHYPQQSESASDFAMREEPDPEIVKDIFMKCNDWLSNQFVPSFFNPRQNVMGSTMLAENGVKAHIFVKYILKLLNEKC